MPLHLLSKKSWNVYSPANRARVARDEALAAAAQRDTNRNNRDGESASTLNLLREQGNKVANSQLSEQEKLLLEATKSIRSSDRDSKKRKRLPGEDDTDRDLRHAKAQSDRHYQEEDVLRLVKLRSSDQKGDAPILDKRGNINLFPEPTEESRNLKSHSEVKKEIERQKGQEESTGMHLKDAWGPKSTAHSWYLEREGHGQKPQGQDVWGNNDPQREKRNAHRIVSADPLAAMQRAQLQLKESKREKEEQSRELKDMRRSRRDGDLNINDFSLNTSTSRHKRRHRRESTNSAPPSRQNNSSQSHSHGEKYSHKHRRQRDDTHRSRSKVKEYQ